MISYVDDLPGSLPISRGFIKVLNRRANGFGTWAKNLKGPFLKFCHCKDKFSCILKVQTTSFNYQKMITFLDNLIMIYFDTNIHQTN